MPNSIQNVKTKFLFEIYTPTNTYKYKYLVHNYFKLKFNKNLGCMFKTLYFTITPL